MNITVYTSKSCIWCTRAKELLASKGYAYSEVDLSNPAERTPEKLVAYDKLTNGARTVPQIIVDGVCIGGFDGLAAAIKAGKL